MKKILSLTLFFALMVCVNVVAQIEEVPFTADFFLDLGGTSLDYFAMVSELQKEFGIDFPAQGERSLNTLKEIYDFIKAGL